MSNQQRTIGFVGLGYAGFPMAVLFARKNERVVGYDISEERIEELKKGIDHNGDVSEKDIKEVLDKGMILTDNLKDIARCDFYIICVPTPVDNHDKPDMSYLISASREVAKVLKPGDIVVYESTVYPGATEEICVHILESLSGLKLNKDFFVGYSPERINPGDKVHTPENIVKVTSGSTPEALEIINTVYESVLGKGNVYPVSQIKIAEACKVIENTQRDVNVAFMNEMAQILSSLDIDTTEVIEAMNTKWNALGFKPGLVGGHCIGIDPYYLKYKAMEMDVPTGIIDTARRVNNSMPLYISENVLEKLGEKSTRRDSKILILGFTFKENCPDIRNTKVIDIYKELSRKIPRTVIYDPVADVELAKKYFGIDIYNKEEQIEGKRYDAILVCVPHENFKDFDYEGHLEKDGFIYDIKGFVPASVRKEIDVKRI